MATTFKGIYNAFDFAYGVNGAASPALQVLQGSNTAGTFTIVCASTTLSSADGQPITITTGTPIQVGADTNIETVTPTAVSQDSFKNWLITATFANPHSTGDQVRSGSAGLQEAAAYAASQGGGLIALTTQWFQALGIAVTPKNTATVGLVARLGALNSLSLAVTLLDYSGSSSAGAATQASSWGAASGSPYAIKVAQLY